MLLCTTLLLARLGGEHVHLCLDGQGPPVSVDGPAGCPPVVGAAAGQKHNDRDVDLQTAVTVKGQPTLSDSLILISGTSLRVLSAPLQVFWISIPRADFVRHSPRQLHPPQRGPPV